MVFRWSLVLSVCGYDNFLGLLTGHLGRLFCGETIHVAFGMYYKPSTRKKRRGRVRDGRRGKGWELGRRTGRIKQDSKKKPKKQLR